MVDDSNGRVLDDFGRETKQRGGGGTKRANSDNTININDVEFDPEAASYDNNSGSRSVSRSNSSSEMESLSSEDSDVAAIKAPLFSDLPPWLTWSFYNDRYFTPMHDYLEERGVTAAVSAGASRTLQVGGSTLSFIAHQTWLLAMQTAIIGGEYSYVLATGIFERLRPHLVEFMEQVVDRDNAQGTNNGNNRAIVNNMNTVGPQRVNDGRQHPPTSPPPPFAEPRDNTPIYTGEHLPALAPLSGMNDEIPVLKTGLLANDQMMQEVAMGTDEVEVQGVVLKEENAKDTEIV